MKRRLILLGPPASGKGTLAVRFQKEYGLPHISSGHLLRREAERGSPIGLRARGFLDRGELVPDSIVVEFMSGWVKAASLTDGFVLDGFPRTVVQAVALDEWLGARGTPVEAVVLLDCELAVVLDRIAGRWGCPKCGRVYHVRSLPPKKAGRCDDCDVALRQREDDTEEVMRQRFAVFVDQTLPVAEYYSRQRKLTRVAPGTGVEERFAEAAAALN